MLRYIASRDRAIAVLTVGPGTGALSQAAGRAGCRRGRAVNHAWGIAVSRDGRYVYSGVAGDGNTGLAVLRRAKP